MLSAQMKKNLRQRAHHLHATVIIGSKGLTDAVLKEIDTHLNAHALIKIKVQHASRPLCRIIVQTINEALGSVLIKQLGGTICIYREIVETA